MDGDLFTYEVEISGLTNIPYDLKEKDDSEQPKSHEPDDDTEGDDEVELTDEESFDFDDENEVAKIFRIDTNVFDFETPMYMDFKEFNYLLQIDPDVLTKDIKGFKTYDDYKDEWIYKWNKDVPWVGEDGTTLRIPRDHEAKEYEREHENKKRCELFDDQEQSVCMIRRFLMIKYSFGDDEEYVAVKENEYYDLTRKDACRTYQEIFRRMDDGWMVTRVE
nr:hypothetical protein [Tanacetum cinerariifolium]